MSKKNIVEHLEHGVQVKCADGARITCEPLMLGDAKFFLEQFEVLESEDINERVAARMRIAQRFAQIYPELAAHIGMGDVEGLLFSFFWRTTGASVVPPNGNGRTGTASLRNTSPSGAPSRT